MDRATLVVTFVLFYVGFSVGLFDIDVTEKVKFRLYTINNKFDDHEVGFDSENLMKSGFDPAKPTKIITHGFLNNGSGMSCIALRDAFLEHHDVNVIIVDYEPIAALTSLTTPDTKIEIVGEYAAKFIDFLIENGNSPSQMHLLGHSLGGHVIGHAARKLTRGKVARVSGLDPGLMGENEFRLSPDVADFVDVIHTCRGVYGMISSIGTVDFYPNGGLAVQPSCDILGGVTCSHYEAVWFMARSIGDPKRYPAHQCDSKYDFDKGKCDSNDVAYMGIDVSPSAKGDYYLATSKNDDE